MTKLKAVAAMRDIATGRETIPEAPLRAVALALDADGVRLCLACTDSMIVPDDVLARVSAQVPVASLLITATHTHHAPCTIDILGAHRDAAFCEALEAALVAAMTQACQALNEPACEADMSFARARRPPSARTAATSSRRNHRLARLSMGGCASPPAPTTPTSPSSPCAAFRRDGLHALLPLGPQHRALTKGAISPGMNGLAAQEIERRHGGLALFLPGAFGSSHNTSEFGSTPNTRAISAASASTASSPQWSGAWPMPADRQHPARSRCWHQRSASSPTASTSSTKLLRRLRWVLEWELHPANPEANASVFRAMRAEMAPVAGQQRESSLTVMAFGDVALVGLPGEIFAALALEIRRRSPFRNTYAIGLANGTLGYVGDLPSSLQGGYQLWAGWHSLSAPGTGEAMVEQALKMLGDLWSKQRCP